MKRWLQVEMKDGSIEFIPYGYQQTMDYGTQEVVFQQIKGNKEKRVPVADILNIKHITN